MSFYFVYIRCEIRAHEFTCLGSQKGVVDPLALKLQVVISHWTQELGIKQVLYKSTARS